MSYIICSQNNNVYVRQNKKGYSLVGNKDQATEWDKIASANNVRKELSKKFCVGDLEVRSVTQECEATIEEVASKELDYDILSKADEIAELAEQAEGRKLYLQEEIRKADLEIVDIEHAAEFYELDAARGYKLYRLLHDVRVKRRGLKNELEKINLFLGASIDSKKLGDLRKRIVGLDNKQYTPRINKELFGV